MRPRMHGSGCPRMHRVRALLVKSSQRDPNVLHVAAPAALTDADLAQATQTPSMSIYVQPFAQRNHRDGDFCTKLSGEMHRLASETQDCSEFDHDHELVSDDEKSFVEISR